jgi:hypothetical protein
MQQTTSPFYKTEWSVRFLRHLLLVLSAVSCKSELKVTTSGGKNAGSCKSTSTTNCDTATNLKWSETSPVSGLQAKATWTPAADSKLLKQKIQFYTGASCNQTSGSEIEISGAATATYTLTVTTSQVVTYKIISQFAATSTTSDCSAAMTFVAPSTSASVTPSTSASSDTTAPTISSITTKSTMNSTASAAITFTISDNTTLACTSQYLSMTSSNTTVVANSSVTWSGTSPNCSAVITPEAGATGTPTITFTVTDSAGLNASTSFSFYVTSAFALGQTTTTDIDGFINGLGSPMQILKSGAKWLILDTGAHRINIYNSEPQIGSVPDVVIGQTSTLGVFANQGQSNVASSSTLSSPSSMAIYGPGIIVADTGNHRILIWNSIPTNSGASADIVIGQSDFTSRSCNQGGSASSSTLCSPRGIKIVGSKLIAVDSTNTRVLIWNTVPTTNNASASVVVGQSNFTNTAGSYTASTFGTAYDVESDGTKLLVADLMGSRILIFNTIPTSNGASADVVVGQSNFTSSSFGTSSQTLYLPQNISFDGTRMMVSDTNNSRLLVWNSIPTTNNAAANFVIGQANMTAYATSPVLGNSATVAPSASTFGGYGKASLIDSKLYVADYFNARILIFTSPISSDGQAANAVLGQPDLQSHLLFNHLGSYASLGHSQGYNYLSSDGTSLFLADYSNHRVMIWDSIPSSYNTPPNVILGQTSLGQRRNGSNSVTSTNFLFPVGTVKIGTKFVASEFANARVMIWNTMPTSNNQSASVVLSAPDFTTPGSGGLSAQDIGAPGSLATDGTKLFLLDLANSRVMVWNTVPTVNYTAANYAIGQPNLTTGNTGTTASTLNGPFSISIAGTKLFIADSGNNRVMVYNTLPTASGASANFALGQPNLTSGTANNGGISASTLSNPRGVYSDGTRVFVADTGNNRILVWNTMPTTSGQPADTVIGQPDFTSSSFSYSNINHLTYNNPHSVYYTGSKLLIGDFLKRVVFLNYP